MNHPFEPKLITALKEGYSFKTFSKDLLAGIIVGIVALPLSIAIAIASGVKPEQGLITAVIAGFLISALSGSRVQIGGPTGAFIVIVYDIVQKYGYDGLATATLMAGVLLILLGIARMGEVIKYIPYPVTVGFTSGIAVIIFSSQVRDFLGLNLMSIPDKFLPKWGTYLTNLDHINLYALGLGLLSIFIILIWRKVTDLLPGPLIAIVVTTALVQLLHLPVETIGSRFGGVPNHFPTPHLPKISLEIMAHLSSPAMAIALLAGIESLLSAVVADGMTGRRHRSNMELIAQGAANLASPLFGGLPATGAIARTATNIRNGGQTPVAGIIHALVVLLIFLFFGQWAALIPMACLAGILTLVAYNMSEWQMFLKLFRSPKSDIMVLIFTFGLTVLVDLTVAIEVGMILAAFLFMKRMVEVTEVKYLNTKEADLQDNAETINAFNANMIPRGIEIFEINGPFFFGAADKFKATIGQLKHQPKVLILRLKDVPTIDATGIRAFEEILQKSRHQKMTIILEGVNEHLYKILDNAGIINTVGQNNIQPDFLNALRYGKSLLPQDRLGPQIPMDKNFPENPQRNTT